MARKPHSKKDRARIFAAADGNCHICSGKIMVGEVWDIEHVIAWALTRDDSDANLRPAHRKCHAAKTVADAGIIAKAKRMQMKNDGTWPKAASRLQGGGFRPGRNRILSIEQSDEVQP